ncbi:MAG: tRNA 2-thiouridine(34) synthase MnmA [Gemmatimonadota bacterium]
MTPPRILMAMSGGVDSSVAAALLVEAGFEVVGATMKTFCYEENSGPTRTCCGLDGILDARRVADHLDIPHYVFDVEEDFTRDVIDDFVSEYAQGRTPNPCVRCNSNTKFRDLLKRGRALGCQGIASGHYVRMERSAQGEPRLLRGLDRGKDQAYFLWGLPPDILPLLHFPVGHLTKHEVRERAEALGLVTAQKPESQEICFVPAGDYRDLLGRRLGARHPALEPGPLVSWTGEVLGEHTGYANYTIGQRKGLGGGFSEALYVIETRPSTREVVVGPLEALSSEVIRVKDLNWLTLPPKPGDTVEIQIRHRAKAAPAIVESRTETELFARFRMPQRAVTPGQSAGIFQNDWLLGGGRIHRLPVEPTQAV